MSFHRMVNSTAKTRIDRGLHGYFTVTGFTRDAVTKALKEKWPNKQFRICTVSFIKGYPLLEVNY